MADVAPILVALATYNEMENLPSLVEAIHAVLPAADVLVVDDNSPDGTGDWCREFSDEASWFRCLHRDGKLGLGTALAAAMQHAADHDYQLLITLDADWSHPPDRLPQLVAATESADVAIGSRYCPGGGIEGWPLRRRIASRMINLLARLLVGLPVSDCSGNCRAYRVGVLRRLDRQDIHAAGYAFLEEILWHLHRDGARFAEVPIVFTDRRAGQSKINLREMIGAARTLTGLAWRRLTGGRRRRS